MASAAAGAEALFSEPNPEVGAGKSRIGVFMLIKEDFSSWSKEQKERAAKPMAQESTYSFGKVKAGTKVNASFIIRNEGESALRFHKVDSESRSLVPSAFHDVAPGGKGTLNAVLDTKGLPKGECLLILTVTTNSPLRPVMNLFVSGWIE